MRKAILVTTGLALVGATGALCFKYGKQLLEEYARFAEEYDRELGHVYGGP